AASRPRARQDLRLVGDGGPTPRCLRWGRGRTAQRARGGGTMNDREQALEVVRSVIADAGIESEPGARDGEIVVTLPGEKKLKTVASLVVGEQALSVSAFVIRNADENHGRFYQFLLRRNLRMRLLAYSIDTSGDVYVGGR